MSKSLLRLFGWTPRWRFYRDLWKQAEHDRREADADLREALHDMKFGPRSYTPEQEAFIQQAVANRKPLPGRPIPMEDEK